MRLDIAAGTAVRFEPGQTRDVTLVALAGKRTIYGFRQDVMGKLDEGAHVRDGRRTGPASKSASCSRAAVRSAPMSGARSRRCST